MGVGGMELTEPDVIVVSSTEHVAQVTVGFVNINELPLGLCVSHVRTRMELDSKASVRLLDVSETGSAGHTENLVVGWLAAGIVLLKEALFLLVLHSVFIEEFIKEVVGIVEREATPPDLVIMDALSGIG